MHTPDPDILSWAAAERRIVLTHDRNPMTGFARTRVKVGQPMPGLFVVDRLAPLGRILNDLEAMAAASQMDEWAGSDYLCLLMILTLHEEKGA